MTHAEEIMRAVAVLVTKEGKEVFSRLDVREQIGVDAHVWQQSYSPVFQSMRADQPGGVPSVGTRFQGVFRQVAHGKHSLTSYGCKLLDGY